MKPKPLSKAVLRGDYDNFNLTTKINKLVADGLFADFMANHDIHSQSERINWIRLARSENIGPATFFRLLEIFGSATEAIEKTPDFTAVAAPRKIISICSESIVEKEMQAAKKFGAEMLIYTDENYPRLLREIYDPAPVLTVRGKKDLLNQDAISIVGPRNASFHACKFAEQISEELGQNEITIISGLAKGIDAAAHRGSIKTGTVAVIAGGIDQIYPSENSTLFRDIFEQGIIISEQPFGGPSRGANFIQRNRIISGMSYGVVVVEAGLQSGSLATARFALEQGREVFAVPGFPNDPRNLGSNLLLEDGAIFTQNATRILREISSMRSRFSEVGILREPENIEFEGPEIKFPSKDDLDKIREEIYARISFVDIQIEEIIIATQLPARLVNIALVQLELADKVSINFGRVVRK